MRIPKGLVMIWSGTHASIPAHWIRKTTVDGRFLKAWGDEAVNTQGGNASHTHSSPSHTHAVDAHTHTGTVPRTNQTRDNQENPNGECANNGHTHTFTTGAVTSSNNFGSTAVTYGTMSNNPPYVEVIFIEADNGAILEDGMIALWAGFGGGTSIPTHYQLCNGSSGAPDYRNKYLRGAGTGANAGATGGSTTNVHDITHGHTGASHAHSGYTVSTDTSNPTLYSQGDCCTPVRHTHTYGATNATTVTPNNYSDSLTTAETVEPAYKKICAIQKLTGGIREKGLVAYWFGSEATIPRGWFAMNGSNSTPDYRNKHIKIASTTGEIGDTGGANTHTHGAQAHVHTIPAHLHLQAETKQHYGITRKGNQSGNNYDYTQDYDTHPAHNTDNATPSTTSANTTADSASNEPEYRTAVFIQYQFATDGGFFLENFI